MTLSTVANRLLLGLVFLAPLGAAAQPASPLSEARAKYAAEFFEEAIPLLQAQIDARRLSQAEAIDAYRMLALSYMHEGRLVDARQAAAELLVANPDYDPDPTQGPPSQRYSDSFRKMIYGLRDELNMPVPRHVLIAQSSAPLKAVRDEWLEQAEEAYDAGQHGQAASLVRAQLKEGDLGVVEKAQAYRMQGLAYVADGQQRKARKATTRMIHIYPEYESEAYGDPEDFKVIVDETRGQYESGAYHEGIRRQKRLKQAVYMLAGAGIVGVFASTMALDF